MIKLLKIFVTVFVVINMTQGHAGIIKINQTAFKPSAGRITFSEFALGTNNPTYNPSDYAGDANSPIVSFGGFFLGQQLSSSPGTDCPGGVASGCVSGSPSSTLTLDANSPFTSIESDGSNPTSPVLSGSPLYNGPIGILFSKDVAGVGLDGGYFDAIGGTAITAFSRDGSLLGSVKNEAHGIEFLGLVTDNGANKIAGLLFSLIGSEPAGFGIDNVRFGNSDQLVIPNVPEPFTLTLLSMGLLGLGWSRRKI